MTKAAKYVMFLFLMGLTLNSCSSKDCDKLDEVIVTTWTHEIERIDVQFRSDGVLIDNSDFFVPRNFNGVILDEKFWELFGRTLQVSGTSSLNPGVLFLSSVPVDFFDCYTLELEYAFNTEVFRKK